MIQDRCVNQRVGKQQGVADSYVGFHDVAPAVGGAQRCPKARVGANGVTSCRSVTAQLQTGTQPAIASGLQWPLWGQGARDNGEHTILYV